MTSYIEDTIIELINDLTDASGQPKLEIVQEICDFIICCYGEKLER